MRKKIPIEILEIETENYHPIIKCRFNDGSIGSWVIDTGASKSVFDKKLCGYYELLETESEEIHSAGISEEPLKSRMAVLNPFSLGKFNVEQLKVALLDLSHVNKLYSKSTHIEICGLLGSDFLMNHKAVIDYRKKRLILLK